VEQKATNLVVAKLLFVILPEQSVKLDDVSVLEMVINDEPN